MRKLLTHKLTLTAAGWGIVAGGMYRTVVEASPWPFVAAVLLVAWIAAERTVNRLERRDDAYNEAAVEAASAKLREQGHDVPARDGGAL